MNTRQVKAYLGKTLAADCELFGASRQGDWIHVTFAIFPAGTGDAAEGHRPGVLTARIPYNQVNAELLSLPDHQPLRIEGPIAQVEPYAIRLKSVDFKVL
jgi:hypothetical protein